MSRCQIMVQYAAKGDAESAAIAASIRYGKKFKAYQCLVHGCWHVGRTGHWGGYPPKKGKPLLKPVDRSVRY